MNHAYIKFTNSDKLVHSLNEIGFINTLIIKLTIRKPKEYVHRMSES